MANTRISDLTASASNLASTDLAPVVQTVGVGPVKMTGLQLAGGLLGSTTFNGATSAGTALGTVAITGTGGQFSCAAATLVVGQNVTISGTLGGTGSITGYSSPTTYTISATNGSTTFTLVNASTGAALTTTAGTPTGLTYVVTSPVVNFTQTWNNSNVTFTGLKFNATDTVSAAGSLLLDLQVGGKSQVRVSKAGSLTTSDITVWSNQTPGGTTSKALWSGPNSTVVIGRSGTGVAYATGNGFGFSNSTQLIWGTDESGGNGNLILRRAADATLQLGAADTTGTTAPTPQFLRVQSWSSSTNNNQLGADFTIQGSRGTGTGAGGSIIFQVAPASGSSNGVQNAYSTALTIDSAKKLTTYGSIDNSTGSATALQYSAGASQPCFGFDTAAAGFGLYGSLSAGYFYGPTYGGATGFGVSSTSALGFCVSTFPGTGMDVTLFRDNSNILALRNGTNAQKFRVYNTYTSSTSYEDFEIDWQTTANIALVGPTKGSGGGTQRVQRLQYLEDGGTGSTTPSLGTTCPAASATIKSWIKVITSDGTTAYIPCWA